MKAEELESILEGGQETQRIDFKGPCAWNVDRFAKDILALSNVLDGGHIIVGIEETEEGVFKRKGLNKEQKDTFQIDLMKDQMSSYADPHVNFIVDFPNDKAGNTYAVITVFQFEEIPVICSKDSKETKKAVIYYRNKDRRIESAPISNSYDMRDIIKLATVRMMQRKLELGFKVEPGSKKILDDELAGL